jgi:hypothetical protein
VFEISAKANPSLGLWTFVDSERKVVSKNDYGAVDTTENPLRIIAPENAEKLLVTLITADGGYVVKFGSEILDYFNSTENLEAIVEGVEYTFPVAAIGTKRFDAIMKSGIPYTYTNNTSASQSLTLYSSSGSSKTLTQALAAGATYIIIPDSDYVQIGGYFAGTGSARLTSDSVPDTQKAFKRSFINDIIFEQGAITITGTKTNNSKRLRTASKLHGSFDLYLPEGFVIVTLAYYNNTDDTFDSYVQPGNANFWRVEEKTGKYVQFSIKKDDDSDITVNDLKASDALEEISNKFTLSWIDETIFERGSIYSTGADVESDVRLRTRYMLFGNKTFSLPDGMLFAKIVFYNLDGSFYSVLDLNRKTYTVTDSAHKYRFVIKNTSEAEIYVDDLKGIQSLESLQESIDFANFPSMVEFEIEHTLPNTEDVSSDIGNLNFNSTSIVQDEG